MIGFSASIRAVSGGSIDPPFIEGDRHGLTVPPPRASGGSIDPPFIEGRRRRRLRWWQSCLADQLIRPSLKDGIPTATATATASGGSIDPPFIEGHERLGPSIGVVVSGGSIDPPFIEGGNSREERRRKQSLADQLIRPSLKVTAMAAGVVLAAVWRIN